MLNAKKLLTVAFIMIFMFAASTTSFADIYMNVDGIEGESLNSNYVDWIEIESYVLSMSLPEVTLSSSSRGTPKKINSPIEITKVLDKSTPLLFEKLAKGENISHIDIVVTQSSGRDGESTLLMIQLGNAMIVGATTGGSNDGIPMDQFSIMYETITMEYPSGNTMFEDSGR